MKTRKDNKTIESEGNEMKEKWKNRNESKDKRKEKK
jgi:hypothetical protein